MVSEHANPLATPGSVDAGGQNVHVASLSRALARRGHTVTVYTRRDDPEPPIRVPLCEGVDVVHVTAGPPRRIPKDELLPHMGAFAAELAAAWALETPDVVHSHFWMSGLAAMSGADGCGLSAVRPPVLHTFHALGSVKRRHQGAADTSPAERVWLEPRVGRHADGVIATCEDEVGELRALGIPTHHVEVAPCGVDAELFAHEGPTEARGARFRILSVGRLVRRKGVDLVIRALALLRERGFGENGFGEVELEIVGSGESSGADDPEIARLSALAEKFGVSEQVHFRGSLPQDRIPALLRSADAVVCAPWYEPFGIVPLEAMACGTPVVAAAVGGLNNSVLHGVTGLHVPPRDPEAIAEALTRLLLDRGFREALGRAGRSRVEAEYTWDRVAERTEAIYERALDRARHVARRLEEAAS